MGPQRSKALRFKESALFCDYSLGISFVTTDQMSKPVVGIYHPSCWSLPYTPSSCHSFPSCLLCRKHTGAELFRWRMGGFSLPQPTGTKHSPCNTPIFKTVKREGQTLYFSHKLLVSQSHEKECISLYTYQAYRDTLNPWPFPTLLRTTEESCGFWQVLFSLENSCTNDAVAIR